MFRLQDGAFTPFVPTIRLGLWVGRKTTPNRTKQSAEVVEALRSGRRPVFGVGSPHQFPACPWCGAVIDPGQHITVEHYSSGRARTIVYCGDSLGLCEYSRPPFVVVAAYSPSIRW